LRPQQSALILRLVRRAHAARIRAVGQILSLRDMGLSRVWTSAAQSGCERI
jgi:hypothetical protein